MQTWSLQWACSAGKPQGSLQVLLGFAFHLVPFALKGEFCRFNHPHLHPAYKEIGRHLCSFITEISNFSIFTFLHIKQ